MFYIENDLESSIKIETSNYSFKSNTTTRYTGACLETKLYDIDIFKTFNSGECYSVLDGIVSPIPYADPRDMGLNITRSISRNGMSSDKGVFIIKTFRLIDIRMLTRHMTHFIDSRGVLESNIYTQLKDSLTRIYNSDSNVRKFNFRVIDFISYHDLASHNIKSKILGGYITLDPRVPNETSSRYQSIRFELCGDGSSKWITIGNHVISLKTNPLLKENRMVLEDDGEELVSYHIDSDLHKFIFDSRNIANTFKLDNNLNDKKYSIDAMNAYTNALKAKVSYKETLLKDAALVRNYELDMSLETLKVKKNILDYRISSSNHYKTFSDNLVKILKDIFSISKLFI